MFSKLTEKDVMRILLIFILLLGFWLIIGPENSKKQMSASNQVTSEKSDKKIKAADYNHRVNHHLSFTDRNMHRQAEKTAMENDLSASPSGGYNDADPKIVPNHEGVDLSTDPRAEDLAEKLGRGRVDFGNPKNAKEIIQSELFDEDQNRHYTEAYKEAYAKAYVAQALREGYVVKLSKDYKVISVEPLRGPSNENGNEIFDSSPGGAQ